MAGRALVDGSERTLRERQYKRLVGSRVPPESPARGEMGSEHPVNLVCEVAVFTRMLDPGGHTVYGRRSGCSSFQKLNVRHDGHERSEYSS